MAINGRDDWLRVTASAPCPICKHPDWCCVTADGKLARCMRIPEGAFKTAEQKDGSPYYLHRLDGPPPAGPSSPRLPPGAEALRAGPDLLHAVYSALLGALILSQRHRENLRGRGLSPDEIELRCYRSLPERGRTRAARDLYERFCDPLLTVPGFFHKAGADSRPYFCIAGRPGLLIPVRDSSGRILALQLRREDDDPGPRYTYLSSKSKGGPGPGTPAHVPLGVPGSADVVRLTEGALKADVAQALTGLPTIGAPGAASWGKARGDLQQLGSRTVRLAFDADAWENPTVARALAACSRALEDQGLAVELERWDNADGKTKGIDDLLVTGRVPELLTGDGARDAIREAVAAATAGEVSYRPDEMQRVEAILAEGGPQALFADRRALEALAHLQLSDPGTYVAFKLRHKGLLPARELAAAVKPLLSKVAGERPAILLDVAGYRVAGGCLVRRQEKDNVAVEVPLCNFTASIVEYVISDDGAQESSYYVVAGTLADGRALPPVRVPESKFDELAWVTTSWGGLAIIYAGQGTRDHLRVAIRLNSRNATRRRVYAHTGWRFIDNRWHYLHAGGAIGPEGPAPDVEVALPPALENFLLPPPPAGEARAAAIRASLALLRDGLIPDRIIFPLLAAVYRAALGDAAGPPDFSLFLVGETQEGKSELEAMAQQHYGARMDRLKFPANWSSTPNFLETLTFYAKDALLVIDDFAPGPGNDRQHLNHKAERVFRAQGNRQGRQRLNAESNLTPEKPARGSVLATGEDLPWVQSVRGRLLVVDVTKGEVPLDSRLRAYQDAARAGVYAEALAGFVRWLAPQYGELCERLPARRTELQEWALTGAGGAPRTPGVVADLILAWELFLDFALDAGAVTRAEREALAQRGREAFQETGAGQQNHGQQRDPVEMFHRLLQGVIGSAAHVAGWKGGPPAENPEAWGWRARTTGLGDRERTEWWPQGERIGWTDDKGNLYLEPEITYAALQDLARRQGDELSVGRTLHKRLYDRGVLKSVEKREGKVISYSVRKTIEGTPRGFLLLPAAPPPPPEFRAHRAKHGSNSNPEEDLGLRADPELARNCALGQRADGALFPDQRADCALNSDQRADTTPYGDTASDESARFARYFETPPLPRRQIRRHHRPGARLVFQDAAGRKCGRSDGVRWTWPGADRWYDAREWLPPSS